MGHPLVFCGHNLYYIHALISVLFTREGNDINDDNYVCLLPLQTTVEYASLSALFLMRACVFSGTLFLASSYSEVEFSHLSTR